MNMQNKKGKEPKYGKHDNQVLFPASSPYSFTYLRAVQNREEFIQGLFAQAEQSYRAHREIKELTKNDK